MTTPLPHSQELEPNKRPGVDAGWRVMVAFLRPRPRATQAGRSADSHAMDEWPRPGLPDPQP
jgi:hypothetical protein